MLIFFWDETIRGIPQFLDHGFSSEKKSYNIQMKPLKTFHSSMMGL